MLVEYPDGLVGGVGKKRNGVELQGVITDLVTFGGIEADEKHLSFQDFGFR